MDDPNHAPSPSRPPSLSQALEQLSRAVDNDPDLRAALRTLALWVLESTAGPPGAGSASATLSPPASSTPPAEAPRADPGPGTDRETATPAAPVPERPPAPRVAKEITLGGTPLKVEVPLEPRGPGPHIISYPPAAEAPRTDVARAPEPDPDPVLVVRRARLKAECCLWAIERRRQLSAGSDFEAFIKPRDQELIAQARALPNCYAWPLDPHGKELTDEELERTAQCYQNLSRAAEFLLQVRSRGEEDEVKEQTFALLAEAQSAMRIMTRRLEMRDDQDQYEAFRWLRLRTNEEHVYIERHMRLDDPADPDLAPDLEARLARAIEAWSSQRTALEARDRLLKRARYHAKRLRESPDDAQDWSRVRDSLRELVAGGMPPSNVDLRDLLLPLIEDVPADWDDDPHLRRILHEVDRYIATRETARPPAAAPGDALSPEVRQARELLRGRVVVMIGGERRNETAERLESTFELRELRWIITREHQSTAEFESYVARPETALVILAIRWSSHSFEDVADMCARYGKAFVRLPRGYGANQIAREVLLQASGALQRLAPA